MKMKINDATKLENITENDSVYEITKSNGNKFMIYRTEDKIYYPCMMPFIRKATCGSCILVPCNEDITYCFCVNPNYRECIESIGDDLQNLSDKKCGEYVKKKFKEYNIEC
jgi:hypothetical protein